MSARQYSSTVPPKTLNGSLTSSGTTMVLSDGTGLPSAPYSLVIEPDTANEEIVTVTAGTYTGLTIVRGVDGTTGVAHDSAVAVRHMLTARDVQELQNHVEASSVYTINDPNAHSGTVSMSVHGITTGEGSVVGTAKTQTLTNKTIALGSNTVSGTKAQFNSAMTDADFATLAGAETLTNKTLTAPTISSSLTATSVPVYVTEGYLTISGTAVTASAAELNKLDGVTATTTELNYTDGLGDAWSTWSPTVSGWSLGTSTFRYRKVGRIVYFNIVLGSAVPNTDTATLSIALPVTAAYGFAVTAYAYPSEVQFYGSQASANTTTISFIREEQFLNASSYDIKLSGTYESAS